MAGRACINPESKKALLERLGDKCEIDESGICEVIESFPECGAVPRRLRGKRATARRAPKEYPDDFEDEEVQDLPERPMGMIPVMGMPQRRKVKRPRKLSEYQKHQSVCLTPGNGMTFPECVAAWRKGESMASQYKGNGMTK